LRDRWRILIVVTQRPPRGPRLAGAETGGPPPYDVALMTARLLKLGAEVRVIDQDYDRFSHRLARREARLWRADLVLLYAGGSMIENDPVPDPRPLSGLLAGWSWTAPVVAVGPLAARYGEELCRALPRLSGVLAGPVSEELVGRFDPSSTPGLGVLEDGVLVSNAPLDAEDVEPALPAWHVLPLENYPGRGPQRTRMAIIGGAPRDLTGTLAEVRHAVNRAGARFLQFDVRSMGADPEAAAAMGRRMLAAAPAVPWACRVRADHVSPDLVLALSRGGCQEVLVTSPASPDAPAQSPMDDPARSKIENAVDVIRVTGLSAVVHYVVGRPGHTRTILSAWQRWFKDRRIAVRPHVRLLHAGARSPGRPNLAEARAGAGCWENELTPADVERCVRMLGGGRVPVAGAAP